MKNRTIYRSDGTVVTATKDDAAVGDAGPSDIVETEAADRRGWLERLISFIFGGFMVAALSVGVQAAITSGMGIPTIYDDGGVSIRAGRVNGKMSNHKFGNNIAC
jgi:hypothetical protein